MCLFYVYSGGPNTFSGVFACLAVKQSRMLPKDLHFLLQFPLLAAKLHRSWALGFWRVWRPWCGASSQNHLRVHFASTDVWKGQQEHIGASSESDSMSCSISSNHLNMFKALSLQPRIFQPKDGRHSANTTRGRILPRTYNHFTQLLKKHKLK